MPEEINKPTSKEVSENLVNSLRSGKDIYDTFSENFSRQYLISGKTMEQWRTYFKLKIPQDTGPAQCKELDMRLLELVQEASFMKARADAVETALSTSNKEQFSTNFRALVADHKTKGLKLPASATLQELSRIDELETALGAASIAKSFWKEVLENLDRARKLVESAGINNSIEAKLTRQVN